MLDKLEQDNIAAAAAAKKTPKDPTASSAMSFDPINEEENEDGESGNGKLPRASAKAAGDDGEVALEEGFSDEDKKKDKKKKDKKKSGRSTARSAVRESAKAKKPAPKRAAAKGRPAAGQAPFTLAIDIGGTGTKMLTLDSRKRRGL